MDDHEDMRDLVAAHGLDAVDGEELGRVEEHLRFCPRCRADLASYRETAALMTYSGEGVPAGLWERIVAELDPPPTTRPMQPLLGGPRQMPRRRRGVRLVAWAAATAIVAGLGGVLAHDTARIAALDASVADQTVARSLVGAAIDPSARRVALVASNGPERADAVVLRDGRGFLVNDGLAPLPASRTYQLWAVIAGKPVSAGLLGTRPGITEFRTNPDLVGLAITDEPRGGSSQPTAAPVATGPLG